MTFERTVNYNISQPSMVDGDKKDWQEKFGKDLVCELNKLQGLDFDSHSKILSIVLYKHENQMRRAKYLQFLRKIINIASRVNCRDIIEFFSELWIRFNEEGRNLKFDLQSGVMKHKVAKRLISQGCIAIQGLATCKKAASQIAYNLQLGTFMTFNILAFSCISRMRVFFKALLDININLCLLLVRFPSTDCKESKVFQAFVFGEIRILELHNKKLSLDFQSRDVGHGRKAHAVKSFLPRVTSVNKDLDIGVMVSKFQAESQEYFGECKENGKVDTVREVKKEKVHGITSIGQCLKRTVKSRKRYRHLLNCICWICKFEKKHFPRQLCRLVASLQRRSKKNKQRANTDFLKKYVFQKRNLASRTFKAAADSKMAVRSQKTANKSSDIFTVSSPPFCHIAVPINIQPSLVPSKDEIDFIFDKF